MTKQSETDPQQQELGTPAVIPVLFGNEGYKPDARVDPPPPITQEDWLLEAIPARDVLLRGEAVSPRLVERLFIQATAVIEDVVPPAARSKKRGE